MSNQLIMLIYNLILIQWSPPGWYPQRLSLTWVEMYRCSRGMGVMGEGRG